MDFFSLSQKINLAVKQAKTVLVASHQKPDADALGSLVAFGYWLESLGKDVTQFCVDQPPANLSWLLNFRPLVTNPVELQKKHYDLVVVLDAGDLNYAGLADFISSLPNLPVIINIDHHQTNQQFGQINLVLPQAVSTTEILYKFFKDLKIKITSEMSSALLAGIVYDTYNFTNPNTTAQSLSTTSQLLARGASLLKVSEAILKNKNLETLKVWGKILTRLSYNEELGIATTVIFSTDLPDTPGAMDLTEGIANFLNNLGGVKAALILQQQEARVIKGSLRTNDDLIDVAKLAKMLGGGGHRKAAGFKIKGQLVQTENGGWQVV